MQLLISDLHLDESRPQTIAAFLEFLDRRAGAASALYILGDLFEVWIGDDDDADFLEPIKTAIHTLSHRGTNVIIVHGNRDFLLGKQFAAQTGAKLLTEPLTLDTPGGLAVLVHGDSLCTDDIDYQRFRQQVRSPSWQAEFLARPLAERRAIAAELRAQSRSMSSRKAIDIMDVNPIAVTDLLRQTSAQILIHGHTHRPQTHNLDGGFKRIVLGDWDQLGWCCQIDDTGCTLDSWPIK